MKRFWLLLLPLTLWAAPPSDLLLVNGNIYTGNEARPRAEAVLVRDGRIAAVDTNAELQSPRAGSPRVIDLKGATVVPGFNDAHMHLLGVGMRERSFDLEGTTGVTDLREKLRARVALTGPKQWITGRGWIETHWQPAAFPPRQRSR